MKSDLKNIFILIRPFQHVKNLLIFMPLLFVDRVNGIEAVSNGVMAFVAFSISASALYILNDYKDMTEDRKHPLKKNRPLVSGSVAEDVAIFLIVIFLITGSCLMAATSLQALAFLVSYITINIAYSLQLKHIVFLDVIILAFGFVLRLFVGSSATAIPLPMWVILMMFFLGVFLALAKRRGDVLAFTDADRNGGKVMDGYSLPLIDGAIMVMTLVVIIVSILFINGVRPW